MANLGSNPRKFSSQIYAPRIDAYCLLSNGPHFVHLEVFNRDGEIVGVSANPVIVKNVCLWAQRCGKMQEWLNRPRDVYLRFALVPVPSFSSLVGWLDSTDALKNTNWNNMSVNNEYPIKECLNTQAFIHVDSVSKWWKTAEEGFTADVSEILVVYVFRLSYTWQIDLQTGFTLALTHP